VFNPGLPVLRILPMAEKMRLLRGMQVDFLRVVRFTQAFSQTAAPEFIARDLHEALGISHVVTGEDFMFGHNREGSAAMLHAMARALNFGATACPQVEVDGVRCSSTRIREALKAGKVEAAAKLLGRPYAMCGHVQQGEKRGRTLGFPTANLFPLPVFLPAFGVYAVRVKVRGRLVPGVANLGIRPTFGGIRPRLEAHLFDWSGDIYGERLEVELAHFIRPERAFDGVEALTKQIAEDGAKAREML
jgi:riboflavin kinase/FMN adenylyltransferase